MSDHKPGCEECAAYARFVAAAMARAETFGDLRPSAMTLAEFVETETIARAYLAIWAAQRSGVLVDPPDYDGFNSHPQTWRLRAWNLALHYDVRGPLDAYLRAQRVEPFVKRMNQLERWYAIALEDARRANRPTTARG